MVYSGKMENIHILNLNIELLFMARSPYHPPPPPRPFYKGRGVAGKEANDGLHYVMMIYMGWIR